MSEKYIDAGDRVRVVSVDSVHGGCNDKGFLGKEGDVVRNDGWGLCEVIFADGQHEHFWNCSQLELVKDTKKGPQDG